MPNGLMTPLTQSGSPAATPAGKRQVRCSPQRPRPRDSARRSHRCRRNCNAGRPIIDGLQIHHHAAGGRGHQRAPELRGHDAHRTGVGARGSRGIERGDARRRQFVDAARGNVLAHRNRIGVQARSVARRRRSRWYSGPPTAANRRAVVQIVCEGLHVDLIVIQEQCRAAQRQGIAAARDHVALEPFGVFILERAPGDYIDRMEYARGRGRRWALSTAA